MTGWSYILAAYALTWIVLVGYVVHLGRRRRKVVRLVAALRSDGQPGAGGEP